MDPSGQTALLVSCPLAPPQEPGSPSHAGSRRPGRCWPGPRASARRRFRRRRQQLIAPYSRDGESVSLADRLVDGECWRRPSRPGPATRGSPQSRADVAPGEAAQEGAQGGWRFDTQESAGRPAGAQRIGVAMQSPPASADHHLVAGVRPARRAAEVEVLPEELGKAKAQGEGGGKTARHCVEGDPSGWLRGSIYWVLLFWLLSQRATLLFLQNRV